MKELAVELLQRLSEAHGVSAHEGQVRQIMRDVLGSGCHVDRMGNLMCEKSGSGSSPRVLLAAHMDEIGFAVQSIGANGWLRVVALGGWWPHTLLAQRVRISNRAGEEVVGVIASKPPHMLGAGEREKVRKIEDLYIDIGARDGDEVRGVFGIELGDPVVPDVAFARMTNRDWLMGKAFDDRVGVALMLQLHELLQETDHPNTVCLAGTVQEELGARGARTVCASLEPEVAIVLEGTPADDLPGIAPDERQGVPGSGVQIRLMDPTAVMNRGLAEFAIETAKSCGIPHQVAVRRTGGTDAQAIHLHEQGVPTVVLGVPTRYIHTHNSMLHLDDYEATLTLLLEMISRLDHATVASFMVY